MQLGSPLDAVSEALAHACFEALQPVRYFKRDFTIRFDAQERARRAGVEATNGPSAAWPGAYANRRPARHEAVIVGLFPQTWGSTALGFGGVGGAAMTPAYTAIVRGPEGDRAVYFAGEFAYRVLPTMTLDQLAAFEADIARLAVVGVQEAGGRYGAQGVHVPTLDAAPETPGARKKAKP